MEVMLEYFRSALSRENVNSIAVTFSRERKMTFY